MRYVKSIIFISAIISSLLLINSCSLESGRLSYSSSNVYITNVYDYKVTLEEYDYNDQGGGPSYFEYDENEKLLKKTFVRADGLKTITDFEYDENGLLTKSIRSYNSGEKGTFNYKFNGNRRLVEKTFSLPNNVEGYERYEYNEEMQLVKGELKNFDTWLTGTIHYEYDDKGKLKVGHYKGEPFQIERKVKDENGNETTQLVTQQFDAEIYFTVDENNNVTKYIWEFSYGATQTYTFTYEKIE